MAQKWDFSCLNQLIDTTFERQLYPKIMYLSLVLRIWRFWAGFRPIEKMQNATSFAKRAVWGQSRHFGPWGVLIWPNYGAQS